MRKILPLIFVIAFFGCSYESTTVRDFSDAVRKPSIGYIYIAALIEANTNFSSLLYDKTKVKFDYNKPIVIKKISPENRVFIAPVKREHGGELTYDETIRNALKNYIVINKFAQIAVDEKSADYILVANIVDSPQMVIGKNFSKLEITIFDREGNVAYFSKISGYSKSDENFWYFPSKRAKPVSYISLKTLEYTFKKQLKKAFVRGA
ncbi:hypothetical protein FHQ18_02150 [Deferribacter autotrophicus]|uniref:Lipoprotein n=1 Tax=Deferribacter autotrophicus TaxID=500465 RepID=A0A5A8F513_9BACT|nr:hypothetical protein [Deferribacter autotrophicus]KAA0258770.1 hypothetical protein FHQ18_02150 [Deferribacter autotrophicus]